MTGQEQRRRPYWASSAAVDRDGRLSVDVATQAHDETALRLVARHRPDGATLSAPLIPGGGAVSASLDLPATATARVDVWDLYVEERAHGEPVLVRLPDAREQPGAPVRGRTDEEVLEVFHTSHGNLSVQRRPVRPRAEVRRLEFRDGEIHIQGQLLDHVTGAAAVVALVAVSRADRSEVTATARGSGGNFEGRLAVDQIFGAADSPTGGFDVFLRVRIGGDPASLLRLHAPRSKGPGPGWGTFPSLRSSRGGVDFHCRPRYTARGNLSLAIRRVASTAQARAADPRRPHPPVLVRTALGLWLRRAEARTSRGRGVASRATSGRPPRKVYFLIRSVYGMGGTVRTVVTQANHLASLGYRVEIISLFRPRAKPGFAIDRRVVVTPLFDERIAAGKRANPIIGMRSHVVGALLTRLLHRWSSVLIHPGEVMFPRGSVLTDILLVRALQGLRPGVLLSTRPALNVAAARFASTGVRTIGQEHHNFPSYHPDLLAWTLDSYGGLDALAVLTTGDEKDYGRALADTPTLIRRIPNGLPRLPDEISDQSSKVVIAAGRLTKLKGYDLLLRAFAQVAEVDDAWELRIFGRGPEEAALQRQIARLGLAGRAHLMGRTNTMSTEMARGSVFALSSRHEGLPMVIIEAMGAGLPVVSFDCQRGPADLVEHGVDGLLVPPADVDGLARGLLTVIQDRELRESMATAARAKAGTFTVERIGEHWEELMHELVPRLERRRPKET